jgi:hypothetical protein
MRVVSAAYALAEVQRTARSLSIVKEEAMITNGTRFLGDETILENNRRAIEVGIKGAVSAVLSVVLSVGQDSFYWPLTSDRPDHAHSTRSHTTINLQVPLGHTLEG